MGATMGKRGGNEREMKNEGRKKEKNPKGSV